DGNQIPTSHRDSSEACDVSLGRGYLTTDGFNRSMRLQVRGSAQGAEPGTMSIRADAVFHDVIRISQDPLEVLGALHEESNRFFEALVTDETRGIMGGRS